MQACSGKDIQFWVLDRPNPIGLDNVENTPLLDKNFSFVGSLPIANRHGLTAGEYALFAKKHLGLDIDLQIARYSGRGAFPWVFPSPNMPTIQTALVYPGQCLFEATELSEGRGCTRPFELFGAPYINPWKIQDELKSIDLPGVAFRPLYFQPTFQKHAGKVCGGFQIHVSNAKIFKPLLTSLCLMWLIKNCYPDQFKWREKPYEFIEDIPAIDLLVGHDHFRETLDSGQDLLTCLDASCYSEHQFIDSEFFLYPRKWS